MEVRENYYQHVRRDISPLLPRAVSRIVDVGCGVGATAAWLKSLYPDCFTIGLEGNPTLLGQLRGNVDEAHIVDLNREAPDLGAPDLILFLDVLEHLVNPPDVIARLTRTLKPHGTIIVSLPNIAHLSVSIPLLVRGQFSYQDAGILDRTHLHFFTRRSAVALLNDAGFTVRRGMPTGASGPRTRVLNRITFGLLRDRLAKQYALAAVRCDTRGASEPIEWLPAR